MSDSPALLSSVASVIFAATSTATFAGNFETCISGDYPTLCKHDLLTPDQAAQVRRAELNANYRTCISGDYPTLCKHDLLTPDQAQQVRKAERGGYPISQPLPRSDEITDGKPEQKSSDPRVRLVQQHLSALGYNPGEADGLIGPLTSDAIRDFQRDHGLQPDGRISSTLFSALRLSVQKKNEQQKATPPLTGEPKIAESPENWPIWRPLTSERRVMHSSTEMRPSEVYENVKGSVWMIVAGRHAADFSKLRALAQGSAVAVSPTTLVTNCHVVKQRPIIILIQGNTIIEARLVSAESSLDRCIIEAKSASLIPVKGIRQFTDLKVGERVYSVGAPSGLERTLGEGIISGLRTSKEGHFIQTTAPISPGSSGGGLFDSSANLIGITTFLVKGAQSLNFSIAAEDFWQTPLDTTGLTEFKPRQ